MSTDYLDTQRLGAPAGNAGDVMRQITVLVVTVGTILVNYLAVTLPLNGLTTGEISDRFPVLFTPAGYVFSIWSVIYLGLLAYALYQALPGERANSRLREIGWLYVASGLANSVWIVLWHNLQIGWSVVAMLLLLASLSLIYVRLRQERTEVSSGEWWTTHLVFSIYLGWITVATVANVTILLYDAGWNGFGIAPELWAVIMLMVASGLGAYFALRRHDIVYVAVLIWALIGIAVKHSAVPSVPWAASGLALVLAICAVAGWLRRPGNGPQPTRQGA